MKKILAILLITIFSATFAQQNPRLERIKSLRIAYLSDKLALTTDEAQKFWPIYNEFEAKQLELRKKKRTLNQKLKSENAPAISEKDLNQILDDSDNLEGDIQSNRKRFTKSLIGIIPPQKILMLKHIEDDFKRKMLDQIGKRNSRKNR